MKIGLLAFHQAINFGATLQLLSTYRYLLNRNFTPVVINWVAKDLENYYNKTSTEAQLTLQFHIRQGIWRETRLCRSSLDVAKVIEEERIEAVIIGSDAVCQCHTLLERLTFPCRTIVGIKGVTTPETFPNAFWADWNDYLKQPIPVAVISASSQDSKYSYFLGRTRKEMERLVLSYSYLSVRDEWTQKMMVHITRGLLCPEITPDPVFAFSQNAEEILPSRSDILERFNLPAKYILLSFIDARTVSQEWLDRFAYYAKEQDGAECVLLPFAQKQSFGQTKRKITLPLSAIDWYALLRYSQGYVGHNMHPLIVCLHNDVPFFSFDNYGIKRLNGFLPTDKSSKIRHILENAGLPRQRVSCIAKIFEPPTPEFVYDQMKTINHDRVYSFARKKLNQYNEMMTNALVALMS